MANMKSAEGRGYRFVTGQRPQSLNFNKIMVGKQKLSDNIALLMKDNLGRDYRTTLGNIDRDFVVRALETKNLAQLRTLSQYFFSTNGIYMRLCRYLAYLYRYDYFITPIIIDESIKETKIVEGWMKAATLLENSNLKKMFGEIALKVIKNGCYYGIKMVDKEGVYLQELPVDYCRARYRHKGLPAVEFNVKYFDDLFRDTKYKLRVLKLFPKEIQKAYVAYKKGTLPKDTNEDDAGWILLDVNSTFKFNLSETDVPIFTSVIPALMDLDEAQDLDKQKMKQQLLRIIIQQMPLDKNGDMIFDLDEAAQMHTNAANMLGKAIGVNVLTTFADVSVADMSDKSNVSSVDQLDKVERTVYNEAGVSQMQFNTSGNLALEKSIANDEASMSDLILQFENFACGLLEPFNKNRRRLYYTVQILPTTIYNYKDLAKTYKEQTMIGFSKLLPQVALGQSQLSVMSTALFENKILKLDELFTPPQMSSTMSNKDKEEVKEKEPSPNEEKGEPSAGDEGGRPELPEDQKSEKTIQNEESGGQ